MNFFEFPETIQFWVRDLLVWVGYGTIVGLLAKAIMPGRDPGGTIATLAMGIAGVIIGCGVATMFLEGKTVTPDQPAGTLLWNGGGVCPALVLPHTWRLLVRDWRYGTNSAQAPCVSASARGIRRLSNPGFSQIA